MTGALDPHPEPAPASAAPDVIYLPHVPLSVIQVQPKKPKRHRGHVEQFRTDDDEHAELAALARNAGLSLGAYYRRELLGDPGPRSKRAAPTVDHQWRTRQITAINRVGNLINQGIHAVNEIKRTAPEATDRDRLAYELEAVRKLLESAIPALIDATRTAADDVREG